MAKAAKGVAAAAEVIRKHPVEVQKALIETCLQFDSALTLEEKARTCRISPEELNAAYEASRCLVSALRFLKEAPATSLLEDLHLDAEVMALLKAMASSNVRVYLHFVITWATGNSCFAFDIFDRSHEFDGNKVIEGRVLKFSCTLNLRQSTFPEHSTTASIMVSWIWNVGKPAGPLGKLVNVEWKIGVAAMSDLCKNLNSPFVMLELTVEDSASHRSRHTIELTVPEFQKFASTMQELHSVMTTV